MFAFYSHKMTPNVFIFSVLREKRRKKRWGPLWIRERRMAMAPGLSTVSIVHDRGVIFCKAGWGSVALLCGSGRSLFAVVAGEAEGDGAPEEACAHLDRQVALVVCIPNPDIAAIFDDARVGGGLHAQGFRSEEHTSELQS